MNRESNCISLYTALRELSSGNTVANINCCITDIYRVDVEADNLVLFLLINTRSEGRAERTGSPSIRV